MPLKIPTYDSPQVALNPVSGTKQESIASPAMFDAAGEQQMKLGNAVQGVGEVQSAIQTDMQMQANQVRVDDALNQARQKALDLTYNEKDGYLAQKGNVALQRPNGQALPDEYAEKLQTGVGDISQSLGNDAQRRAFALQANNIVTSFKGSAQQHMLSEYKNYALSVQDGTVKIGVDTAKLNWSDPDKIQESLNSVKAGVAKTGQLLGEAASETVAKMKVMESSVHLGVIDAALQNNNPTYALAYLDKQIKAGTMTADDILKTQGAVNRATDAHLALGSVSATTAKFMSTFQPADIDRLKGVVIGIESNGRDTNADGTPLTSKKGALYAMQVMPATAKNPGFGIEPAKDDSAAEYNRVGTQYLNAMVQKYGEAPKAMAAYNAGPGAVDDAVKQYGNNWLAHMPQETKDYVTKGMSKFSTGGGAPPIPTKMEFVDSALAQLPPNPRPELVTLTREQAEKQYGLITTSRKEQGEQALSKAQQALISNGGDFARLDPQIKSDLARFDPGKYDDAVKFAKTIGRGDQATNLAAYNAAVTYPEEMAGMSDAQFLQFQKDNFSAADAEKIAKMRADYKNGKVDTSNEGVNSKAVNTVLQERIRNVGINPTPDKKDQKANEQVGTIQKFVRDDILEQQRQSGKKMTPKEIEERIDTLFTKSVGFRNTFLGMSAGRTDQNMLSMKWEDVPSESQDRLKQLFTAKGVKNPSENDMLRAYWRWKNG